mmetsp:Transcript_100840/g.260644  ORF Transcript_100840/g.260644 Transcript_100840/m.260644 type:complete len:404 (+) Transcript_100840:102-1313(+)
MLTAYALAPAKRLPIGSMVSLALSAESTCAMLLYCIPLLIGATRLSAEALVVGRRVQVTGITGCPSSNIPPGVLIAASVTATLRGHIWPPLPDHAAALGLCGTTLRARAGGDGPAGGTHAGHCVRVATRRAAPEAARPPRLALDIFEPGCALRPGCRIVRPSVAALTLAAAGRRAPLVQPPSVLLLLPATVCVLRIGRAVRLSPHRVARIALAQLLARRRVRGGALISPGVRGRSPSLPSSLATAVPTRILRVLLGVLPALLPALTLLGSAGAQVTSLATLGVRLFLQPLQGVGDLLSRSVQGHHEGHSVPDVVGREERVDVRRAVSALEQAVQVELQRHGEVKVDQHRARLAEVEVPARGHLASHDEDGGLAHLEALEAGLPYRLRSAKVQGLGLDVFEGLA